MTKVLSVKFAVLRTLHAPFAWWASLTTDKKNGVLVVGIFAFLAGVAFGSVMAYVR